MISLHPYKMPNVWYKYHYQGLRTTTQPLFNFQLSTFNIQHSQERMPILAHSGNHNYLLPMLIPLWRSLIAASALLVLLPSVSSFVVAPWRIHHIPMQGCSMGGSISIHSIHSIYSILQKQNTNPQRGCRRMAVVLAAKKKGNNWDNNDKALKEFITEQETRATAATESWVVDATGFLEPAQSSALLNVLQGRADVDCLSVGSYRNQGVKEANARRVRCVFANPDLGYDPQTADADYVSYLKIDNVSLSQCNPWPNLLVKIGLSLDTVGDIFLVQNDSVVYLAVNPESEKTCIRLLPKELPGVGVTVTKLSKEEMDADMAVLSDGDGMIVDDMEVQRVDKRQQKQ
jgi:RNA-binding protein YlmH